jgi:hypothetical protein
VRVVLAWLGWSWLLPLTAAAQSGVSWTAPAGCPTAAEAQAVLGRLLGDRVESGAGSTVVIQRAADRSFAAVITLDARGDVRRRVLRDPDCEALTRAAAVVVALAFSAGARSRPNPPPVAEPVPPPQNSPPERVTAAPRGAPPQHATSAAPEAAAPRADGAATGAAPTAAEPPEAGARALAARSGAAPSAAGPRSVPDAAAAPSGAASSRSTPEAAAARSGSAPSIAESTGPAEAFGDDAGAAAGSPRTAASEFNPFVAVAGRLQGGVLPNLAPGVELSAGFSNAAWSAALRLSYAPAQRAALADPRGVGGRIGLTTAALEAGPRWRVIGLELPLIAGFEAGMFDAHGTGLMGDSPRGTLWLCAYLGSGLTFAWGRRFALGLSADALVPLRRPQFGAQAPDGEIRVFHRPGTLAGRAALRVEARFP